MLTTPAWPQPVRTTSPLPDHVDDHGLVVEDQRVGLPPARPLCLVEREAGLEIAGAVHLAGDQHAASEQEGGPAVLDHLEAAVGQ
jgi:hypothetical protein